MKKTYKIVKIWFTEAKEQNEALSNVKKESPDFISASDNFKVGKEEIYKRFNKKAEE